MNSVDPRERRSRIIASWRDGRLHREAHELTYEPIHGIKNLVRKAERLGDDVAIAGRGARGDGRNSNFSLDREETEEFAKRLEIGWGSAKATLDWLEERRRNRGIECGAVSLKTIYSIRARMLKEQAGTGSQTPRGLVETVTLSKDPGVWHHIMRDRWLDCGTSRKALINLLPHSVGKVLPKKWTEDWSEWIKANGEEALWRIAERNLGAGRFKSLLKNLNVARVTWPAMDTSRIWDVIGVHYSNDNFSAILTSVLRIPRSGVYFKSGYVIKRNKERLKNIPVARILSHKERKEYKYTNWKIRISHEKRKVTFEDRLRYVREISYLVYTNNKSLIEFEIGVGTENISIAECDDAARNFFLRVLGIQDAPPGGGGGAKIT